MGPRLDRRLDADLQCYRTTSISAIRTVSATKLQSRMREAGFRPQEYTVDCKRALGKYN